MSPLNRKLFRDLKRLRGQVIAIALVIGSGVGVLAMSLSTYEALKETGDIYYERYQFADIFANLKRAPQRLKSKIAAIEGVQNVQTRITAIASIDLAGFAEPVIGQLVSVPTRQAPILNQLALQSGRMVAPDRVDEVIVSRPFAEAHSLIVGDQLQVVMNGHKRTLDIVGIALSPEFVYAIGPGALMPDDERFGILWLGHEAMAAAYDLEGAFNNVTLSILRGADAEAVITRLDRLLEKFGGLAAVERADQISNWFLTNELKQLQTLSTILPAIFLLVAAFLTNMVVSRLITVETG